MKRLFLASLVSATLIGCGGSDGGASPPTPPPVDDNKPLIPLEPSTPVEPEQPLIPLEPSTPVEPEQPLIPLEPSTPVEPEQPLIPLEPSTPVVPPTDLVPANYAPVVSSVPNFSLSLDEVVYHQIEASDANGDELYYTARSGSEFITVDSNGYMVIHGDPNYAGTHEISVAVSDGSLTTITNTFEVRVSLPMTDIEPAPTPPTEDCGIGGECLEDEFEVDATFAELVNLDLSNKAINEVLALCQMSDGVWCGIDHATDMFFVGYGATRFYPETKTFSDSYQLATSGNKEGIEFTVKGSSLKYNSDQSEESEHVVEIFDDNDVYAVMMFETDIVEIYQIINHGDSFVMSGEMTIEKTLDGVSIEDTHTVSFYVSNSLARIVNAIAEDIYGGTKAYHQELASRLNADIDEFDTICNTKGYTCYGMPSGAANVANYNNGVMYYLNDESSSLRLMREFEVTQDYVDNYYTFSTEAHIWFEDESWYEVNYSTASHYNNLTFETYHKLILTPEFLSGVENGQVVNISGKTLYADNEFTYQDSFVIENDVLFNTLKQELAK
ncbi:Ig-like domain-containing protein [Vibrio owensii]|uniref:Ig-like domain-containing protein n=1 Tax=Vibrio owensii TaxID=696485 RepID=UPI0040688545